jgi:hypothetical protein
MEEKEREKAKKSKQVAAKKTILNKKPPRPHSYRNNYQLICTIKPII